MKIFVDISGGHHYIRPFLCVCHFRVLFKGSDPVTSYILYAKISNIYLICLIFCNHQMLGPSLLSKANNEKSPPPPGYHLIQVKSDNGLCTKKYDTCMLP